MQCGEYITFRSEGIKIKTIIDKETAINSKMYKLQAKKIS